MKPRLAETGQGFSVLKTVEYNGRFLYSKYSPDKAILQSVEKLVILPGTIVLINSPVLWYGFEALLNKLPEDCFVFALEADTELYKFAETYTPDYIKEHSIFSNCQDLSLLDNQFRNLVNTGKYRRLLSIDFSAAAAYEKDKYSLIKNALQEIIERFWKNRITITKLGKLYSKNVLKNLPYLASHPQLSKLQKTVCKPIIVCGAGESLDELFKTDEFGKCLQKDFFNKNFYILSTDAALQPLQERGIDVNGIVLLEAQFAITKAFLGVKKSNATLFMDLCSRTDIKDFISDNTTFFATEYASSNFLNRLKEEGLVECFIQGVGSVGIEAISIALTLRKNNDIPVILTGMDFSYTAGRTHCKGTFHDKARFLLQKRNFSSENVAPAFSLNSISISGKTGKTVYTSPAMLNYASITSRLFCNEKNIYDYGSTGIDLGFNRISFDSLAIFAKNIPNENINETKTFETKDKCHAISFLKSELNSLEALKDLLINGENSSHYKASFTLHDQIQKLLEDRDYLYFHFPDGHRLSMDTNFLKRVRAETDYFIKVIKKSINQ